MVNSTTNPPHVEIIGDFPLSRIQERILSVFYVFFLYLCFVGLLPFGPRKIYALDETGGGDFYQQVIFLALAGIFSGFIFIRQNWRVIRIVGLLAILATGWALISSIWSETPGISFRRSVFAIVVMLIVYTSTSLLGPRRIFNLLFYVLFGLILASIISGPIVPNAVHREGMSGAEDLIGLWRGVFIHKNIAGSSAALLILLASQQLIYSNLIKNKIHLWAALILSTLLLFLAFSKTSILLIVPTSVFSAFLYFFIAERTIMYRALLTTIILMVIVLVVGSFAYLDITSIVNDPKAVTGRSAIWSAILKMIDDRPLLGFGYGSVFEVGQATPLKNYTPKEYSLQWISGVSNAHNGYLQVAVEQGYIGLILVITAFILIPFKSVIFSASIPKVFLPSLLAIMTFFLFHNLFEATLFIRNSPTWVAFLIMVSIVNYYSLLTPVPREENSA